jgi:hypothetical protein
MHQCTVSTLLSYLVCISEASIGWAHLCCRVLVVSSEQFCGLIEHRQIVFIMGGIVSRSNALAGQQTPIRYVCRRRSTSETPLSIDDMNLKDADDDVVAFRDNSCGAGAAAHNSVLKSLKDIPLLSYDVITKSMVPLCRASWKDSQEVALDGVLLPASFQRRVETRLYNPGSTNRDISMAVLEMLNLSRYTKDFNPMTHIMQYAVNTCRGGADHQVERKLIALGREHSRIGITPEMITLLCEVLLSSFASCIYYCYANFEEIMTAWSALMKYLVTHMTRVQFTFLRTVSGTVICPRCAGLRSPSPGLCGQCVSRSNSFGSQSVLSVATRRTFVDELSYSCDGDISPMFQPRRVIVYAADAAK